LTLRAAIKERHAARKFGMNRKRQTSGNTSGAFAKDGREFRRQFLENERFW